MSAAPEPIFNVVQEFTSGLLKSSPTLPPISMQTPKLADLAVGTAEAALRVARLRLQSAEVETDAARTSVQLAELSRYHAVKRRELGTLRQQADDSSGAGVPVNAPSPPTSPAAKRAKTAASDALVEAERRLAEAQSQEPEAQKAVEAARGRAEDLRRRLEQCQREMRETLRAAEGQVEQPGGAQTHKVGLASLPEDELLLVLSYLEPRELFACRRVCRRWANVAMHRDLWSKRSLREYSDNVGLIAAALRRSPCLRSLTLHRDPFDRLGVLLALSWCAVSELDITVRAEHAVLCAMLLSKQASMGRLKKLKVNVESSSVLKSPCALRHLLQEVLSIRGLETIKVKLSADFAKAKDLLKAVGYEYRAPPALRELVHKNDFADPYLPLQLEWHAATLEVVRFQSAFDGAASLLSVLPRLRELRCPLLADMEDLHCPALRTLHLEVYVGDATRPCLPGAGVFLRDAVAHLEELTLEYDENEENAAAVNLVLSLAGCGSAAPALRRLAFSYVDAFVWTVQEVMRPLTAVLHRLERLVSLNICGPLPRDFLDALDGKVLPLLEELCFTFNSDCPHAWAHGAVAKSVLRRYPRLHLVVDPAHDPSECSYCVAKTCHDLDEDEAFTIFSHPVEAPCGVEHKAREMHIALD
ncbi:uncharacterized protein LOC117654253 isoform X2 [Thrips palmi]|uniref:Uncharacterized protein LOC117654253 isoform X2 n=1 Tax=Thrips palmi TaxID=161013 RepID=A0A6P9AE28_THRPL|nr:uncharacterized protein LOC117654253 isoform X2 [Thrips palmi]